jgi:hypothetical protein
MAVVVGQMTAVAAPASAQGWTGQHRPGQAAPAGRPAPQAVVRPQGPRVATAPPAVRHAAPVARPHFGGGGYQRPHRGGGDRVAAGIALGVGAFMVGSAIASASGRASVRPSNYERCAARFESFDWDTGTYENEDGDRIVCPYLD